MADKHHYRSIFKATSLIGGSALINILIGMVRTKFVAVLLGPAGVGLMGMFTTLLGPINTLAGMGLATSGVRQITSAYGRGDSKRIGEVVSVLRITVWGSGIIGCLLTIVFSPWLSEWTFKTPEYAVSIAVLGVTVLLGNVAVGQMCILQGTRRIAEIAKISIWGGINGTIISIPCFYLWGIKGVVASLFLVSLAALGVSWYYAGKVKIEKTAPSYDFFKTEVQNLLKFGVPIMASVLQGTIAAYLMRLIIVRQFGLDGVGIWGAAFAISGILVNFVLNAMGTDYYPRLIAVAHDNKLIMQEVNAQTEIALLLAIPALAATILFAPVGIQLLYSGSFDAAIPVLRWSVYGIFGRVLSWPLGYILLAKGRGNLCFLTELTMNLLHLFLVFACGIRWGLPGTGIALIFLYIVHVALMAGISFHFFQTRWTKVVLSRILLAVAILAFSGSLHFIVKNTWGYYSVVAVFLTGVSVYCGKSLLSRMGISIEDIWKKYGVRI